ncbi:hypothetical protein HY479_02320 [Candidatus Uhrbacteria bacterium]|nr:hypothetical protein [Candidatus Uhrbacteria bacterium]
MTVIHQELATGRWHELTLAEQLGNIGSEVGRTKNWRGKDDARFQGAFDRALELFDLTLADKRWKGLRRREIARAREVFCDAATDGGMYTVTLNALERYFFDFALASRHHL